MNKKSEELLDDEWLKEIDKTNKLYQDYYLDDVYYTNVHIIYVNKSNEIEKIKEEILLMKKPNFISREEMIYILKKNMIDNDIRYDLLSILKCNILLQPEEIEKFIVAKDSCDYKEKFITSIKSIDAIHFERTINMFQDLNDILIIYGEKKNNLNKDNPKHNVTKRIIITNRHKKTHRKY